MKRLLSNHRHDIYFVGVVVFLIVCFIFLPNFFSSHYIVSSQHTQSEATTTSVLVPSYVATPNPLRAIYMTSWVSGTDSLRNKLVSLFGTTDVNAVVIDIKDYSGTISFPISNPTLKAYGSESVRVRDLPQFIESLHKKGVYVIARVAVFQDAYFVKFRPDLAVKNKAGTKVWADQKGISWIDPGAREYWDYIILLAKEARNIGFDEVNFDYVRYPSDGDLSDISYPFSSTTPKSDVLQSFFAYLQKGLAGTGLKTSADIFGETTSETGDMGIGQVLEKVLPYFDYVSPMVYPSHYSKGFLNFSNPEAHPYDVVHYEMDTAVTRAENASTSPSKLRPWLQDFGLTMDYGVPEVEAQIQAVHDAGLSSWMLWSASNVYTTGALNKE